MKRKGQLIIGGLITLLIVILASYYLGFWGEKPVKLDTYTQEENDQVSQCLAGLRDAKTYQETKSHLDKLNSLSFQGKQNILHYAFNHGNPDLLRLLAHQPTTMALFEPKDRRGNTAMAYYHQYCKFSNLKPLQKEILAENPLAALNHIVDYFDTKETSYLEDEHKSEEALTLAIEKGELEQVKNFLFSTYGNNDKSQWEKALTTLSHLRSHVAHKDKLENLLSTLKADRKEDDKFWQPIRKFLASAPNVEGMVNYLHKLVATSPQKKSLLYYIIHVGGLRGYQMYKHIEKNHSEKTKTAFSDLFLAANDLHHPIELPPVNGNEYNQRLRTAIDQLQGYRYIDANKFAQVNPKDRRAVQQAQFANRRTYFHACVLNETPEKLEFCCAQYFKHNDLNPYVQYWEQKDVFGLTPADYFPLVKDPAKKQHLRFLEHFILAPTKAETNFLHAYKTKAKELELGNFSFNGFLHAINGLFFTKKKDTERNICHIAARLGDMETIAFLSQHYADFKTLCEAQDTYGRTPQDYAKLWLDKGKSTKMCLYLTTKFDIQGKLTRAAVIQAIQQSNWQQISKWKREDPIGFGALWAKHSYEMWAATVNQAKPTTNVAQYNYFKLLEQLSKCQYPAQKMIANNKALLHKVKVPIATTIDTMRDEVEYLVNQQDNVQLKDTDSIQEVINKLKTHTARFIPDHANQNKTILHTLLPKVVASAPAAELDTLLHIKQESFKIALCMVDDHKNTPLALIKKALKDKKNNAKDVAAKFDILKKYEDDHLATYQSEYKCNIKATATALYKKDNIEGLGVYLRYPASYMSRSLLETILKDGAYDVLEKVCGTHNPYVRSAAKALATPQKDDAPSVLTALLKDKAVKQAVKFRYLLKEGEFIQKLVTPTTPMPTLKQIERIWKAYPVYWAAMANRYWNTNKGHNSTADAPPVWDKLYEKYRFVITDAQKKQYGFNNAHVAVIRNQLALLEKYWHNNPLEVERWLNQTDHMGRTPLYYIDYGIGKTEAAKKALFMFINRCIPLTAVQILKSPTVAGKLPYIREKTRQWARSSPSSEVRQAAIFLSPKEILKKLAKKERAGRNPLHYACLGMDSDLAWLLALLKADHYTQIEIAQVDINGCKPIDYVPEPRKAEFQQVFAIYSAMAELADDHKAVLHACFYLFKCKNDLQYLAQKALNSYEQRHEALARIQAYAQAIANKWDDGKLVDNELSEAIRDELAHNIGELKEALQEIRTNDLGKATENTIINARNALTALSLLKDDDSLDEGTLKKKTHKQQLTSLLKGLVAIHPFVFKTSTLKGLKSAIDTFIATPNSQNLAMSSTVKEVSKVVEKVITRLAKGPKIPKTAAQEGEETTLSLDQISTEIAKLTTVTISAVERAQFLPKDGEVGKALTALVKAAQAYTPDTQKLAVPRYSSAAKKFWRKNWIPNTFAADSWSSLFAVDAIPQENYLPTLYQQLLQPKYAKVAKALIIMHDDLADDLNITLNEQDSEGKTWLLNAIEKKRWDIAAYLVEAGVDLSIKDIYDTNAQFLTIVHKEATGDLKTQLLAYIKNEQNITKQGKASRVFAQAAGWLIKRWQQIFYFDPPTEVQPG